MRSKTCMSWRGCGIVLSVLLAPGLVQAEESFEERTQMARDYLDGKLDVAVPEITYDGPPIEIRLSSFVPEAAGLWAVWNDAFEQLERESEGKLTVRAYPGGVLHGMRDGFSAVRDGIADLSHCYVSYEPTSFNLMHATALAGIFPDAPVGSAVATAMYPKYFKDEYQNMGVYLARTPMTPPYNIVSKTPIRTLEDLEGIRLRTVGGLQSDIATAAGAVPTFVSTPEIYTAFQRGTVDAVAGHDGAFIAFRSAEPAEYWTELRFAGVETSICMNRDFFDNLPDDLQELFYGWLQRWNQADAQLWYEGYADQSRDEMREMGIEMIQPEPDERDRILAAMENANEDWIEEMEGEGLPARQLVDEMQQLSEEYADLTWNELFRRTIDEPVEGIVDF